MQSNNMLLGIYPNKLKLYIHIKTCSQWFLATLFTTAQTWKEPRCPLIEKWINKLWCIHTVEYYSLIKNKWAIKLQNEKEL